MKGELSIVIIGRNEEQGIAKCIAAAQTAASEIGGAEIIFVDSASTDMTARGRFLNGSSGRVAGSEQQALPVCRTLCRFSARNGRIRALHRC